MAPNGSVEHSEVEGSDREPSADPPVEEEPSLDKEPENNHEEEAPVSPPAADATEPAQPSTATTSAQDPAVKQETPGHDESEEPEDVPQPPRSRNRSANARQSAAAARKQSTKAAASAPKRKSGRAAPARGKAKSQQPPSPPPLEAETDWSNKTRCPCGQSEDNGEFMIACDICESWQHTACIGFASEKDIPKDYACPWCKPEMYPFLNKPQGRKQPRARSARSSATGAESARSASPPVAPSQQSAPASSAALHDHPPPRGSRNAAKQSSQPPHHPHPSSHSANAHSNNNNNNTHHNGSAPTSASKEAMEAHAKSVRRRSTMNSRDAAYEANLAEALRLSKAVAGIRESSPLQDGASQASAAAAAAAAAPEVQAQQTSKDEEASDASALKDAKIEQHEVDPVLSNPAHDDPSEDAAMQNGHEPAASADAEDPTKLSVHDQHSRIPQHQPSPTPSEPTTETGKRRRRSSEDEGVPLDAGLNKRRRSHSRSPAHDDVDNSAVVPMPAVATPEPTATAYDQLGEPEADQIDADQPAPAPARKPGRGGARRGGGRGGRRGGKSAAASSHLTDAQEEDDQGLFSRHGSNQYASRLKPIPRSKISPHKRPPINRGGANGHHQNDDPASMVQTVPDHLAHLAHLVPPELISGPAADGPFVSEGGHTKIRFPGKRTTMVEMRKRTKAMLEYLQRVQVDTAERDARPLASGHSTPSAAPTIERKSLGMLDGLQRELNKFQEKFLNVA